MNLHNVIEEVCGRQEESLKDAGWWISWAKESREAKEGLAPLSDGAEEEGDLELAEGIRWGCANGQHAVKDNGRVHWCVVSADETERVTCFLSHLFRGAEGVQRYTADWGRVEFDTYAEAYRWLGRQVLTLRGEGKLP